jgi:magnesium chelatase family protein
MTVYKNECFVFPLKGRTMNLAPADLPITVGILLASGQVSPLSSSVFIGGLSLDGSVRHVDGILAMVSVAKEEGFQRVFVPHSDAPEASLIGGLEVIPVESLSQLVAHLNGSQEIPSYEADPEALSAKRPEYPIDFSDIGGQEHVKRALEVAAAGGHNVLMSGPPGAGETLLVRALPTILPTMTIDEALEVTKIYSVRGLLPVDTPLIIQRPFRSPHHTISHAGLVGGGTWPKPGEISLAHHGVLFLDELPEFGQRVLEVMRQLMEDRVVTISRARTTLTFPTVGDVTVTEHIEVGTNYSGLGWGGGDRHRSFDRGYSTSAPEADVNGDRLKGHSNFDAQKGGHKVNCMLEARDQNPDALV